MGLSDAYLQSGGGIERHQTDGLWLRCRFFVLTLSVRDAVAACAELALGWFGIGGRSQGDDP
jgi:hypothetical protein